MLREIDEKTLKEIIENHQHWLNEDCEGWENLKADLSNADLSDKYFCDVDLSYADFHGSDLSNTNFRLSRLLRADLSHSILFRANLSAANLSNANLSVANLEQSDLRYANLQESNLSEAIFRNSYLINANLTAAILTKADFSNARLIHADLSFAKLYCTAFNEADLSAAMLRNASIRSSNFGYANLHKASLANADFGEDIDKDEISLRYFTHFIGANMIGAQLDKAKISNVDFTDANLSRATFFDASFMEKVYFDHANLGCSNFYDIFDNAKGNLLEYRKGKILTEDIIGYKKCKGDVIVTLCIPRGAIVFSINGNKCRTNKAKVIAIDGADRAISTHKHMSYYVGDEFTIYDFDCQYNEECGKGIHFFMTKEEAESYNYINFTLIKKQ